MAVWRRHNCEAKHRTFRTLAKCMMPYARVSGEGPYVSLSRCPGRWTAFLYPTKAEAETAKSMIDGAACGGKCYGPPGHEILILVKT